MLIRTLDVRRGDTIDAVLRTLHGFVVIPTRTAMTQRPSG